jgi:hypothetical protein
MSRTVANTRELVAASETHLPKHLIEQITRLHQAGYSLIPLGGSDGKKPVISARKNKAPLQLQFILDRMVRCQSRTYGIMLDGLVVVDVDSDTPEARKFVEEHFGTSTVQTKTSRGFHIFFRHSGIKPTKIRMPGIPIDFKSGPSEYVVGPCSIRPDGHQYVACGDLNDKLELPILDLRKPLPIWKPSEKEFPAPSGIAIQKGNRHGELFKRALEWAATSESLEDLLGNLESYRRINFDELETFPPAEVIGIATAVWGYRTNNTLWNGRNSDVRVSRVVMDRLLPRPYGIDAFALYFFLKSNHGHIPGQRFPIVPKKLFSRLKLSQNHIYRARDVLVEEGLLKDLGQAGLNRAKLYQLALGLH